ncbi:uncharacterized protein LOC124425640 [Vespa crabro]|uniref:uncharacterized protein LOC124425640 n=1 Tax=Vespa crabro TaxID=7445 RepID=UPI001F0282B3|nr:uncharacterized protein LOC124425640 [Vespa crabro]
MGLELQTIALTGHGMERKLNVNESFITFLPTVPYMEIQEREFTIENNCEYPIEFFWHHLDNQFIHEDRIAKILTRYYDVEEILLPLRKLAEGIPAILIEFYNDLIDKSTTITKKKKKQVNSQLGDLDHISNLHKDPNFHEIMRDPIKCLFDELELQSTLTEKLEELVEPEKKVCIIFHGAPFTAYQETACRSARALGIPVLSIDTAILEIAAFSKSECSVKLRQAINETYQNYTTKFSEYKSQILAEKLETTRTQKSQSSRKKKQSGETPRTMETPRSEKRDEDLRDEERFLRWTDEPDPFESYNKLSLNEETLISMDVFSQYEHKLQAIKLLEKILSKTVITDPVKDKTSFRESDKSSKKKQKSNFFEIDSDILSEALRERLSEQDFEKGFILQTLRNCFICDEIKTLNILLDVIGHVEFFLFITFYNSRSMRCHCPITINFPRKIKIYILKQSCQ